MRASPGGGELPGSILTTVPQLARSTIKLLETPEEEKATDQSWCADSCSQEASQARKGSTAPLCRAVTLHAQPPTFLPRTGKEAIPSWPRRINMAKFRK
eukprot:1398771-Pleurochrysis_carterae.AAC.2